MKLALALVYFVFAIMLNSVGTVILQVIVTFNVSKLSASVLEPFKDIPIAVMSFLIAPFLPRLGYKNSLMGSVFFAGAACCLMPTFPGFWTTKVMFLCVGLSFAFAKVTIYSSVALVTNDSREHASFMSTIEGLFMVGVLSGYWMFSYFIDPKNPASHVWLNVYWLLAGICLIVFLVVWTTPFENSVEVSQRSFGEDFVAMLALVAKPLVCVFIVSAFLYVLIEQGLGTWLPTFNSQVLGLPAAMSIQATSIFAACLAVGRLSAGPVIHRFGWYPVLNICLAMMALIVLGTLPFTHGLVADPAMTWASAPMAAFVFPLIGLVMAPIYPAMSSVMLSSLPKERHSSMTGLIVIFSALGGSTGSIITGFVFEHYDGRQAFYFSVIPIVAIAITLAVFRKLSLAVKERNHIE